MSVYVQVIPLEKEVKGVAVPVAIKIVHVKHRRKKIDEYTVAERELTDTYIVPAINNWRKWIIKIPKKELREVKGLRELLESLNPEIN